jgi:hypothetical protein
MTKMSTVSIFLPLKYGYRDRWDWVYNYLFNPKYIHFRWEQFLDGVLFLNDVLSNAIA